MQISFNTTHYNVIDTMFVAFHDLMLNLLIDLSAPPAPFIPYGPRAVEDATEYITGLGPKYDSYQPYVMSVAIDAAVWAVANGYRVPSRKPKAIEVSVDRLKAGWQLESSYCRVIGQRSGDRQAGLNFGDWFLSSYFGGAAGPECMRIRAEVDPDAAVELLKEHGFLA